MSGEALKEVIEGAPGLDAQVERAAGPRRRALVAAVVLTTMALAVYAPILYAMGLHWYRVADYSHGFLIVPLAIYFAWQERDRLRQAPIEPSWWGLVPLALGSLTLAVGRLGVELMNMRVSFVLTLMGIVLLVLGRRVFRVLAFPLGFLFLMVPLPQSLVNVVAFPLQLIAADWAVRVLYQLNIPVFLEGNIIHLPETQLFVAEACSGLRSLMALLTLGVVIAYFSRGWVPRLLIVMSAIPIAIVVNANRVALTGLLTYYYGREAATGFFHMTEGLVMFVPAFLLLVGEAWLLGRFWPGKPPSPAAEGSR